MASLTLAVEGMTCNHCVQTVTDALEGVAGVQAVQVSLEAGRAEVEFDPAKAQVEDLVHAVDEEGYSARAL